LAVVAIALGRLRDEIVACRSCPRLVAWREEVARRKVARHRACDYWGRPVPGHGDPKASVLILGLAPGAHGANRTGRVFTGDRSGEFLYAALHRAGLANQPTSTSKDDGLVLRGVYIGLAVRCAPPDNAPAPDEIARCAHFLDDEIAALPHVRAVLALGAIAWRAYLDHAARAGVTLPRPRPAFAHGARVGLARDTASSPSLPPLFGSYHVSQQNTQTGKLTPSMFDEVLRQVLRAATTAKEP
jgi:uracil-DNA glycosylase family 4